MNCEQCLQLLSDHIDGELDRKLSAAVETHLGQCKECALVREDFAGLLNICSEEAEVEVTPPNSQALWCRINNIIETEVKQEIAEKQKAAETAHKRSWFGPLRWQVTLGQIVAGVMAIGILSSLLTFVAVKNFGPVGETAHNDLVAKQPSLFDRALSKVGLMETPAQTRERRIREQQNAIEYWNQRIEARRAQWDKNLRLAFERNLQEIDQVVSEHTKTLEENPQDELSGEMLDDALTEKMQLLREFAEL